MNTTPNITDLFAPKVDVPRIIEGDHTLALAKLLIERKGAVFFILEARVESSTTAAVGSKVGVCWNMISNPAARSNIRAVVAALVGAEVTAPLLEDLRSPDQPGRGLLVRCFTEWITTKAGLPFMAYRWQALPNDPTEAVARRASLDAAGF